MHLPASDIRHKDGDDKSVDTITASRSEFGCATLASAMADAVERLEYAPTTFRLSATDLRGSENSTFYYYSLAEKSLIYNSIGDGLDMLLFSGWKSVRNFWNTFFFHFHRQ